MVDSTTNLNTSFTNALNDVLQYSNGSVDEMSAINHAILSGEGIDQIIEAFAEENPAFAQALKNNKNELKKPNAELSQLMEENIEIPKEIAEKLGLAGINNPNEKITVSIGSFRQAALKEALKDSENTFGFGNLNSETIDLLCLLLCQDSKEELISTLKIVLKSKVIERQNLSNDYQAKTVEMAKDEIEAQKAAEKAKKMSIITSIVSAIVAAVITVASVAFTIATCGAGAFAMTMAAIAITAAVASTAATIASTGCTIASLETNDPEKKEKLDKAVFGLGIASAVLGLVGGGAEIIGSVASTAAKVGTNAAMNVAKNAGYTMAKGSAKAIGKAASEAAENVIKESGKNVAKKTLEKAAKGAAREAIEKSTVGLTDEVAEEMAEATAKAVTKRLTNGDLLKNISTGVTAVSSGIQGLTQIATGVINIESAKKQKELADIKIEMAKLDQEIETLVAFIDTLTQDIQKFMEDYLKNEQEAAEALQAKGDIELQLSQKTA